MSQSILTTPISIFTYSWGRILAALGSVPLSTPLDPTAVSVTFIPPRAPTPGSPVNEHSLFPPEFASDAGIVTAAQHAFSVLNYLLPEAFAEATPEEAEEPDGARLITLPVLVKGKPLLSYAADPEKRKEAKEWLEWLGKSILQEEDVEIEIRVGEGEGEAEFWTCDFSYVSSFRLCRIRRWKNRC